MEEKDKEFEISIDTEVGTGSLKLKNFKNRVVASIGDIIVDQLSYFRWNNTLKFLDKYNRKRARRKLEGKETPLPPKFILEVLENAIQEADNKYLETRLTNLSEADVNGNKYQWNIDRLSENRIMMSLSLEKSDNSIILLVIIISISAMIGFIVYNNFKRKQEISNQI